MTIRIPHSLDAVIQAVEALIDGRPMPEDWSKGPEPVPVVKETEEPVPQPQPQPALFDEALLIQAISDLIDKKVSDLPQPKEPDLQPIQNRLQQLENAFASLPDGFPEALLLNLDIQKSQTIANTDLERRVAAVETIIAGLSSAIHKEGAA